MKFTFTYGLVPVEFVPPSGMQHAADYAGVAAAVWEQAASDAARNIAMTIWPIFDRQNPTLDRTRDKLTDADFSIMNEMRPTGDWKTITTAKVGASTLNALFKCEDSVWAERAEYNKTTKKYESIPAGFEASFALYAGHHQTDRDVIDALGTVMFPNTFDGVQWVIQSLKHRFQRPRAFQTAFDNASEKFLHKLSATAHSPSLPSGHCIESLFAATNACVSLDNQSPWFADIDKIVEWSASVADRRVYAGLHYPSDNFASWICMHHLIPILFATSGDQTTARHCIKLVIAESECWRRSKNYDAFLDARELLQALYKGLA